ncbi:MAG: PQQ-like beta-propeller repeat protein, partial [Planctomycetota bacterium]|nr:PQQ-like beta-propeller repeat protein [Planctomycetota bacterium]
MTRTILLLAALTTSSPAGDWPQILGPNRTGVAEGEVIADRLPPSPKPLWKRDVGDGFAGVAVKGGTAYLFHRVDDQERVEAMSAKTGKVLWKGDSATEYASQISPDRGPRCVPVVTNDRVIVFGAQGLLRCLDRKTGKELWSNVTHKTFQAQEGYFGAGSTPVVEGGLVLVNVGAPKTHAGIVAFNLQSGKVAWKATDEQPSYSSPIVADVAGQRQAIFVTRYNCLGVAPKTGKVLWTLPFGSRGPTVNAATPVLLGDRMFLTSSYGVGAVFAKLTADSAEELWKDRNLMASQYTTPIEHEGALIGIDGRQDVGPVSLRCLDPSAKKILWDEKDFGYATLMRADGKLLAQKTDCTLVLI